MAAAKGVSLPFLFMLSTKVLKFFLALFSYESNVVVTELDAYHFLLLLVSSLMSEKLYDAESTDLQTSS